MVFDPVDHVEGDPEELRRQLEAHVRACPRISGRVWNARELHEEFIVEGEAQPVVAVRSRATQQQGTLMHRDGLYWGFEPATPGD